VVSCGLEEFKNTKGVITILKSKKDTQHNVLMENDKQRSTKHYTEN